MTNTIEKHYDDYYRNRNSQEHIYPVEFVVRSFLGTYPKLKLNPKDFPGNRILDLGFGDGRNFPLLQNLGFKIYGVEISEDILSLAKTKFDRLGILVDLNLGSNSDIPFETNFFDYILGCHSIYYVKTGETFDTNLAEIARVLKPGGTLVASLAMSSTYVVQEAKDIGNGHVEIQNDPLGLRNGTIFRVFSEENEIRDAFSPYFDQCIIGNCCDDFFGIQQDVWIVVCRRA